MIRTLHWYISRELARVTLLAVVALTLVMTVFAVIEPVRKIGLEAAQLSSLFAYTIPVMLSLTLPVAALFASTIVYGRFAQDNELLACRASGVSTFHLLRPAMALGIVITIVSLIVNNYVTPRMAALGEKAVKSNVKGIAFRQLQSKTFVEYQDYIVHAGQVDAENSKLTGLVVADCRNKKDIKILVAPEAQVNFSQVDGDWYATMELLNYCYASTGENSVFQEGSQSLPAQRVRNLTREKASFYDWSQLQEVLREPTLHGEIRRSLEFIRSKIGYDRFGSEIADTISAGNSYDKLKSGQETYQLLAAAATVIPNGVQLEGGMRDNKPRPVEVVVLRDGKFERRITANRGQIRCTSSKITPDETFASISLDGRVIVEAADGTLTQREHFWIGQVAIPGNIIESARQISLKEICDNGDKLCRNAGILKDIDRLKNDRISRLMNNIKAEMHSRIAYSISCFLLVVMGASLGLIFRGGQVISAFAISVVPATLMIVLLLMGKQLITNPDSNHVAGFLAIWGGIVALALGNSVILAYLARK